MAEEQAPGIPGIGVSETGPTPNPSSETSDLKRKLESGENGEPEPKKSQIADANGVSVASGAPPGPQMPPAAVAAHPQVAAPVAAPVVAAAPALVGAPGAVPGVPGMVVGAPPVAGVPPPAAVGAAPAAPVAAPVAAAPAMGVPGPAVVSTPALALPAGPSITQSFDVDQAKVGIIIGRGGEIIKYLMSQSGAHIQIDQNMPQGLPRKVVMTGTAEACAKAEALVRDVMENGPPKMGPPPGETWITEKVECDPFAVGRIIGRGGEVIRDLQARSGCKMQVDQSMPDGAPRQVVCTGTPAQVAEATNLVRQILAGQSLPPRAGPNAQYINCPKELVGRIIGRGGEVIRNLQGMANARVQIDQNMDPCQICVSGPDPNAVYYAVQLVQDVMANGPQALQARQYAGAPPAGGYGQPPPAYGGYPGYDPYAQQAAAAYAGYPPAAGYDPYGQAAAAAYAAAAAAGAAAAAAPAAAAPAAAGGSEWSEHKMPDGTPYWYNATTGVSQWEKPN